MWMQARQQQFLYKTPQHLCSDHNLITHSSILVFQFSFPDPTHFVFMGYCQYVLCDCFGDHCALHETFSFSGSLYLSYIHRYFFMQTCNNWVQLYILERTMYDF